MDLGWNAGPQDSALQRLVAGEDGDVIVWLDRRGLIRRATPNIVRLGCDPAEMLLKPHVADLAHRDHQTAIREFVDRGLREDGSQDTIEFALPGSTPGDDGNDQRGLRFAGNAKLAWYSMGLFPLRESHGEGAGALGLLRSLAYLRNLERELSISAATDALTGLDNHSAFMAQLERMAGGSSVSALVLCELDHVPALQAQFGRPTCDDILWAFGQFLGAHASEGFVLARVDRARFGIVLPGYEIARARRWAEEMVAALKALGATNREAEPYISASVGIVALEGDPDEALRKAEIALIMARSSGQVHQYTRLYTAGGSGSGLGPGRSSG